MCKNLFPLHCLSILLLVVGRCLIHYISKRHTYRAYSFLYVTVVFENIYLVFSRFGVTVPRDGAEPQACKRSYRTESMKEALRLVKNEGWSMYKVITIIYPGPF
jgi:hypothetical protein